MAGTEWMSKRRCADADPELFHPDHSPHYASARVFCEACPVVSECLNYELSWMRANPHEVTHGMWGNTTPPQRMRLVSLVAA